jgi:ABC-type transport system involved in cytochrome c biogenesis permease subunit
MADDLFLWLALIACLVAAVAATWAVLMPAQRQLRAAAGPDQPLADRRALAGWLAALPLAAFAAAIALRTLETGRAPLANLHEVLSALAATLVAAHLVFTRRIPGLAVIVTLAAAALAYAALRLPPPPEPLVPALQAPLLLPIHVGSAVIAYAAATVASIAAGGELLVTALGPERGRRLPSARLLRGITHRAVLVALPLLTAAIALGSLWANLAGRSYWSNDPKELSAAATWLVLGAYLHAEGRRDRWGRAAPWLAVVGFGAVLFTLVGASLLFGGQHSYAQV